MTTLFGKLDEIAMDRMRQFEPPEGYWLAFSGGKDSVVLLDLAKRSGVKFEAHYSVCPDPPELHRFIKKEHPEAIWDTHPWGFHERILQQKMPPLRNRRWCCREFKETATEGFWLTGITWAESAKRSHRRMVESCSRGTARRFLHPIIDWTETDVWDHIRSHDLPYCCLYDEGFKRLGCVGCPMDRSKRWHTRFPNHLKMWRRTFSKLWEQTPKMRARWSSSDAWFEVWLSRDGSMHGDNYSPDEDCDLFGSGGTE